MRYFEDFTPGQVIDMGPRRVSEAEIVAFARRYDNQDFHTDAAAARLTPFGGIVASGWHTIALCMRMMADGYLHDAASLGSPGVDEVRWLKPVRPGDELRYRAVVRETVPSRGKADRGVVHVAFTLSNQRGEKVMTMKAMQMFGRRPALPARPLSQ
jgi:acyl dehydratase